MNLGVGRENSQENAEIYENIFGLKRTGKLSEISARQMILCLHENAFTGQVLFAFREKKKKILFHKGEVVKTQSNLGPELLGTMMCEREWITEEQLQTCVEIQKSMVHAVKQARKIGEIAAEVWSLDRKRIEEIVFQQKIFTFVQALMWEEGDYSIQPREIASEERFPIGVRDVFSSIADLIDLSPTRLGKLFEYSRVFVPGSRSVELTVTPFWQIFAGCRIKEMNGILSVRKQSKLYEIVFKSGSPLTLYEGTVARPRQTVVVRQASEDHEKYFVETIFRLFGALSGTAHFRAVGGSAQTTQEELILEHEATEVYGGESSHSDTRKLSRIQRLFRTLKQKMLARLKRPRSAL